MERRATFPRGKNTTHFVRRALLPLILVIFFCPALRAQWPNGKNACHSERKENVTYRKALWDGYEISLGQVPNPEEVEYRCTAAIYNGTGHVVFRTSGFNVVFDEEQTGKDFDGDGKPEVVFRTDTGGGNHCCWGYIVYSLSPRPHKLFEIAMEGRVMFETDKDGKMVIWKRTAGPGEYTSMAERPFAEKVLRVRDEKLVDATPEFCAKIWSDVNEDHRIAREVLTPENLNKFQKGEGTEAENGPIISALLSRALQHVFCWQFDEALSDLNLWPEASRAEMKASFGASLREEYSEFAEKLREPAKRN